MDACAAFEAGDGVCRRSHLIITDPVVVRREYGSKARLQIRNEAFRALLDGPSAEQEAFAAVGGCAPRKVLEVGSGPGEFAERLHTRLGADVVAVDISPVMVELALQRGVRAQVGDVQQLPFEDGMFDCAFAGWMLYHVPDLERAVAELARVLAPGGRLVATTFGEDMPELWNLVGGDPEQPLAFSLETGTELLRRCFHRVECRRIEAWTVFPTAEEARRYVAATISRAHLADRVPDFNEPFRTRHVQAVFVAEK